MTSASRRLVALLLLSCTPPRATSFARQASSRLHPRNRHAHGYDMQTLATAFPPLQQHVVAPAAPPQDKQQQQRRRQSARAHTIDFAVPAAVEALNAALLTVDYGVQHFNLPKGHLTPAVPGRADYLHILADLLASDHGGSIPRGAAVRGLDIGVGASCVYPIIGHVEYGWAYVGSDVDATSIDSAAAIVRANGYPIDLRRQTSTDRVLKGVLQPGDGCLAFTQCNPPFYASRAEEAAAAARKWKGLQKKKGRARNIRGSTRSFGGSEYELWCPGGEKQFVTTHIRESAASPDAALWFTSLVSSERSMPKLLAELDHVRPARVEQLGVATGNKAMRVLAWSFLADAERRERLALMMAAAGGGEQGDGAHPRPGGRQALESRRATRRACVGALPAAAAFAAAWRHPPLARADLASAGARGLPLVGRFERLKGANAFIGTWRLDCTDGPSGTTLSLLRDGDVELRSAAGALLGTGAAPWSYAQADKGSAIVRVRFSVDVSGGEWDVLYFSGAVDAEGGPARTLEGSLSTGYGRKVGDFVASPVLAAPGAPSAAE